MTRKKGLLFLMDRKIHIGLDTPLFVSGPLSSPTHPTERSTHTHSSFSFRGIQFFIFINVPPLHRPLQLLQYSMDLSPKKKPEHHDHTSQHPRYWDAQKIFTFLRRAKPGRTTVLVCVRSASIPSTKEEENRSSIFGLD